MSTAKFEKLIDLILNEDQERAEQLFHDIVVEKSREIYENLMAEEDEVGSLVDEVSHEMEGGESMYEADDEPEMDMDDAEMDMDDAEMDMDMGDDADAEMNMDDAEMDMDDAEADMDMGDDDMSDGEPATKDDIMNLEDKLDELMAEFEALMNKEEDEEEADMEADEEEEEEEESGVMESVQLKAVPKPKHGDDGANKASPVAKNSGQAGMASKPVKFSGTGDEKGRPAPTAKPVGMKFKNAPGGGSNVDSGESAPKPKHETVKAKSPVPESKRSTKKRL